MTQQFDPDPNKCDCEHWCYDHDKSEVWGYVYPAEDGGPHLLGHHPACDRFYVKPPADASAVATGLSPVEDQPLALVQIALAYHELARRGSPALAALAQLVKALKSDFSEYGPCCFVLDPSAISHGVCGEPAHFEELTSTGRRLYCDQHAAQRPDENHTIQQLPHAPQLREAQRVLRDAKCFT
jgi:hypothetical protein